MRFLAWTGHLTIRSFFGNAAGDIRDTTFGYDANQQASTVENNRRKERNEEMGLAEAW
jgi:hypothetical protein